MKKLIFFLTLISLESHASSLDPMVYLLKTADVRLLETVYLINHLDEPSVDLSICARIGKLAGSFSIVKDLSSLPNKFEMDFSSLKQAVDNLLPRFCGERAVSGSTLESVRIDLTTPEKLNDWGNSLSKEVSRIRDQLEDIRSRNNF